MKQIENIINRYRPILLQEFKDLEINGWIAGGAIRDYCMGIPIKTDHDVFFKSENDFNKTLDYMKSKEGKIKWESDNGCKIKYGKRTFDLIKKYFDTPKQCIDNFDFTVSMFAVDYDNFYYGETSFIDLAKRQLIINELTYPVNTMKRVLRYYEKGFRICNEELLKVIVAIQDFDKIKTNSNKEDDRELTSGEMGEIFRGID